MRLISVSRFALKMAGLAALLALGACSPKPTSQDVSIAFPDWGRLQSAAYVQQSALSTPLADAFPGRVVLIAINVSGPGVSNPVRFFWNRKGSSDVAPSSATINVPAGALVQALAVIQGAGSMMFYYGDTPFSDVNLKVLDIGLSNVAVSQGLSQGTVVGRYLTAPNAGPTGTFSYRFQPPGKPQMTISKGEVFSGWMRVFALSSNLIQYSWQDGTDAFGFNSGSNWLLSQTNPARSARIIIPAGFENENSDATFNMMPSPYSRVTAGFFGPYADTDTTRQLCLTNATTGSPLPVARLYKTADPAIPTAAPSFPMGWVAQSSPTDITTQIYVDAPSPYVAGGSTSGTCASAGVKYADYLVLDHSQLRSPDSILGFRGPFQKLASGSYLDESFNSGTSALDINFALLPGAAAALDGVSLFWRSLPAGYTNADADVRTDDGYRCDDMRARTTVGLPFNEIPVAVAGTTVVTASISGVVNAAAGAQIQVVACPRAPGGRLYKSGVSLESSSSGPTAVRLAAFGVDSAESTAPSPKNVQTNVCSPVLIQAVDLTGMPGTVSSGSTVTLTLTSSSNTDLAYTDSACSQPSVGANPLVLTNFLDHQYIWIKSPHAPAFTGSIAATSSGSLTGTTFYYIMVSATNATELRMLTRSSQWTYDCNDALLVGVDGTTGSAGLVSSTTYNYPTGSLSYFNGSDMNCSNPLSSTFAMGSNPSLPIRTTYSGAANASVTMSTSVGSGLVSPVAKTVSMSASGSPVSIAARGNSNMPVTGCAPIAIQLLDGLGHNSASTSNLSVSATVTTNGNFYTNSGCSLGVTSSVNQTISTGTTQNPTAIYFKPVAVGTSNITVSGAGLTSLGLTITSY